MIIHTALYKELTDKLPVTIPSQNGSLTYTGGVQSPGWTGFYDNLMEISGDTSGTNAGSYTAIFKLKDKKLYEWSDGTVTDKRVNWYISKAAQTLTVNPTTVTLNSSNRNQTITTQFLGDGEVSAFSSDTNIATASVVGTNVLIESVNDTKGEATITISVSNNTNYESASATVSVEAQFVSIGTWESVSLPYKYNTPKTIYANNMFSVIWAGAPGSTSLVNAYSYSKDGTVWNSVTLPRDSKWIDLKYINNKYISIGTSGNSTNGYTNIAIQSEDGINWTFLSTLPNRGLNASLEEAYNCSVTNVIYANGKYFISGSLNFMAYGTDMRNWTVFRGPFIYTSNILYNDNIFVSYGNSSSSTTTPIAYSQNGTSWTKVTFSDEYSFTDMTYGNGKFVAVDGLGNVAYSEDGIIWNVVFVEHCLSSIEYGEGMFIATTVSNTRTKDAFYSEDGIIWTQTKDLPVSHKWGGGRNIAYGDGKFVVVANVNNLDYVNLNNGAYMIVR